MAYRLELPPSSRVHPVFHVSLLKKCVGPGRQVSPQFPTADYAFQVPVRILQSRVKQMGQRTIAQVLVQWSGMLETEATWEDRDFLKQQFPRAPAWGQAGSQEGGIVSVPGPTTLPKEGRPRRQKRPPAWRTSGDWVQ